MIALRTFQCSSASRKFLNMLCPSYPSYHQKFQCSSASRKFLNRLSVITSPTSVSSFSALQRAENSSSASIAAWINCAAGFSALQRAENSSITRVVCQRDVVFRVFQCSSASRKFLNRAAVASGQPLVNQRFSALQRAENSSTTRKITSLSSS